MVGEGPGQALEQGIDRRPVGRIAGVRLLAPRQQVIDAGHALDPLGTVFFEALKRGQEVGVLLGADRPLGKRDVELLRKQLAPASPEADLGHRQRPCPIRLFRRFKSGVPLGLLDAAQQEPSGLIAEIGIEGALLDQLAGEAGLAGRRCRVVLFCLENFRGIRIKEETAVSRSFLTV